MVIFHQSSKTVKYRDLLTCLSTCLAPFTGVSASQLFKRINNCNKPVEWDKFCYFSFVFLMHQDMCWIISQATHNPSVLLMSWEDAVSIKAYFSRVTVDRVEKGKEMGIGRGEKKRQTNIWRGNVKMIEHQFFLIFFIFSKFISDFPHQFNFPAYVVHTVTTLYFWNIRGMYICHGTGLQ